VGGRSRDGGGTRRFEVKREVCDAVAGWSPSTRKRLVILACLNEIRRWKPVIDAAVVSQATEDPGAAHPCQNSSSSANFAAATALRAFAGTRLCGLRRSR
jgi:hypothetical protein